MMDKSVVPGQFGGAPYITLGELYEELETVIHKYDGTLPLMGVVGVLTLLQHTLMTEAMPDAD